MNSKRSADEGSTSVEGRKRIKLASPSPERLSGSDTESIRSCQGYKTESVSDTSDTSSHSLADIEYEITNTEEVPKLKYFCSQDSSDDEFIENSFFIATSNESLDTALLGDTSEENSTSPTSNSDVDPELPRNDYLDFEKCLLCQTDRKNISYPYCSSCYTWKKNLFPKRPKRRKKALRETHSQTTNSSTVSLQNNIVEKKSDNGSLSDPLFEDSGMGSTDPQLSEDVVDGPSQPSTSSSCSTVNSAKSVKSVKCFTESEACRICFSKREDGLFVHSNSAHLYGCYNCAKEIWYNNGGCPICRRKVFKITKLFV